MISKLEDIVTTFAELLSPPAYNVPVPEVPLSRGMQGDGSAFASDLYKNLKQQT